MTLAPSTHDHDDMVRYRLWYIQICGAPSRVNRGSLARGSNRFYLIRDSNHKNIRDDISADNSEFFQTHSQFSITHLVTMS